MAYGLQIFTDTGDLVFDSNANTVVSRVLTGTYSFVKDTVYSNPANYSYYAVYDFNAVLPGLNLRDYYVDINSNSYSPSSYFTENGKLYVFFDNNNMGSYQWSQITSIPFLVTAYRI